MGLSRVDFVLVFKLIRGMYMKAVTTDEVCHGLRRMTMRRCQRGRRDLAGSKKTIAKEMNKDSSSTEVE